MNPKDQNTNKNEVLVKSILYGTIAYWLGKKAENTMTHKWCVYVRGTNNEDISSYVKEVTFVLHNSFPNYIRTLTKFPFELYEKGWGEFDIKIIITLRDPNLRQLELIHTLKLYPHQNQVQTVKKPVIAENYDEIIIVNPSSLMKESLLSVVNDEKSVHINLDEEESRQNQMVLDDPVDTVKDQRLSLDESASINETNLNLNHIDSQVKPDREKSSNYLIDIHPSSFEKISDEAHMKLLNDSNFFVVNEINKIKSQLNEVDSSISTLKKNIREAIQKINTTNASFN